MGVVADVTSSDRPGCVCTNPRAEAGFGLVDPEFEALAVVRRDGTIVGAYPHDSHLFIRRVCGVTRLEELVPDTWLGVLFDRIRAATTTNEASTVELARHGSPDAGRTLRVRIAPGDDDVFVLLRDMAFDPRATLVHETSVDASFWAFFEVAPIALTVGLASSTAAIGPTRFNQRFTTLFGYTSEEVPTVQHWWPLAYPDEAYRDEVRRDWFVRLERAGGDFARIEPVERRVHCKDGSVRDIEINTATVSGRHVVAFIDLTERNRAREELATRVTELEAALAQVKVLRGLVPLCAWCKKLRDDQGYWSRVEEFLAKNTDSKVTHGICPQCQITHFGTIPSG